MQYMINHAAWGFAVITVFPFREREKEGEREREINVLGSFVAWVWFYPWMDRNYGKVSVSMATSRQVQF